MNDNDKQNEVDVVSPRPTTVKEMLDLARADGPRKRPESKWMGRAWVIVVVMVILFAGAVWTFVRTQSFERLQTKGEEHSITWQGITTENFNCELPSQVSNVTLRIGAHVGPGWRSRVVGLTFVGQLNYPTQIENPQDALQAIAREMTGSHTYRKIKEVYVSPETKPPSPYPQYDLIGVRRVKGGKPRFRRIRLIQIGQRIYLVDWSGSDLHKNRILDSVNRVFRSFQIKRPGSTVASAE